MKFFFAALAGFALLGCNGTSTVGTTTAGRSGSGSSGSATSTDTTTTGPGATAGSTGGCKAAGAFDFGDPTSCCSGEADGSQICQAASTGGTSSGSTAGAATGTTTGGTCPENMPDINGGVGYVVDGGSCTELGCPNGFNCESGKCVLHGANGGLQMTLSFDDPEDFDIHVEEPSGKTVWYENTNRPPGSSSGVVGSLDRDSNAGCQFGTQGDGVNIENVIYPSSGIPSGTYKVYVDYWQNCNGKSPSNIGVQVRRDGAIYKYCGQLSGNGDQCGTAICGSLVTSFTYP
jgi:hypothetical protein